MKNIIILLLLFTGASNLFGQENEDKQGETFHGTYYNLNSIINDIDKLMIRSYTSGHKYLEKKGDSLVHVNKNGKRSVRIRDLDANSLTIKKENNEYRVFMECKYGEKKMIADWGKYNTFSFPMKNENDAERVLEKFKIFFSKYN